MRQTDWWVPDFVGVCFTAPMLLCWPHFVKLSRFLSRPSGVKETHCQQQSRTRLYKNNCKHTHCLTFRIHNRFIIPDIIYFTDKETITHDITHHRDIKDPVFERQSSICETYEVRGVISFSLSMREIVIKGLWWIGIMVSGWTSDSWLLCCGEWAAAPSAVGVSSSQSALYRGVVAKHNALISFNSERLQSSLGLHRHRRWILSKYFPLCFFVSI